MFFHMKLITSPTFEIIPELKIAFNGYVNQLQTATKYSLTQDLGLPVAAKCKQIANCRVHGWQSKVK